MIEEEFTKLRESLKRGKILELKKIKKESLLEFIEELEIRIKSREKKIFGNSWLEHRRPYIKLSKCWI